MVTHTTNVGFTATQATWSGEETLRLLDALEAQEAADRARGGDAEATGFDWDDAARHVGRGKTAAQCLVRFLQLPIADATAAGAAPAGWSDATSAGRAAAAVVPSIAPAADSYPVPLCDVSNPVMLRLASLMALVRPSIARAAVRAAFVEYQREREAVRLHQRAAFTAQKQKQEGMKGSAGGRAWPHVLP